MCDHKNRCRVSLHNIVIEVKKDSKQFEDALKYVKVYKKIVHTGTPPTLEENYILESRNFEHPHLSKRLVIWLLWMTVRVQICILWQREI